ncbi:sulfite exporter TauE/SafE family protein [Acetobacteraceae bacterium H6797]|nr:sulfite exporter TauE/SafE family protein [Acetobacteraceae bacterium H6797]
MDPALQYALITLVFILAGFVKGVTGLGLPTVTMGLLGVWMHPAQAAALVVIPALVTNIWQGLWGPGLLSLLRRQGVMLVALALGTGIGMAAGLMQMGGGTLARHLLGGAIVIHAAISLAAPRLTLSPRAARWLAAPAGLLTGLITASTGVAVIPVAAYLQASVPDKEDLVRCLGLAFVTSTAVMGLGLAWNGTLGGTESLASLLGLIPAVLGMLAGNKARRVMSAALFRRCFLSALLALGLWLMLG